jgi:hypothetical protein
MTTESADSLTVEQALELVRLGCVVVADDGNFKPMTEYYGRYREPHFWQPQLRLGYVDKPIDARIAN